MLIGLIPNNQKDKDLKTTKIIAGQIISLGGIPVISEKYIGNLKDSDLSILQTDYRNCDLLICLGGDGTFLSAVHEHINIDIPLIGVNLGSVGFLAEIKPEDSFKSLRRIFSGKYKKEKRILLESVCFSGDGKEKIRTLSLNDVVISRGGVSRILNLELYIDGIFIEQIPGDGIIVSTPTGSTAYSLSAGGPIIQPNLDMILITPLNPHTLHNRCYIVSPESEVKIVIKKYPFNPSLTSDGEDICSLEQSDYICITKSEKFMTLLKLDDSTFYDSLATKIYARGICQQRGINDD